MATTTGGDKAKLVLERIAGDGRIRDLRVGFLENATYPNGTPVAMIAAIQDFGAPSVGIPPRPFFRNMIARNKAGWPGQAANLLVRNKLDYDKTMRQMGEGIVGQLRQSIRDTNAPALAPSTIARKGHAKPLVDTGHMLASADYELKSR